MNASSFWERSDVVERFGDREPDRRLTRWLARRDPSRLRSLDLGCAAGRNCQLLAEAGAEVWAVDSSAAMVQAARARLEPVIGASTAEQRVMRGRMDDLSFFPDAAFDLVVALGVLQNAGSADEWERTLAGTARVLAPGGHCLVANFAPDSQPHGEALERVPGEDDVYYGFGGPHDRITLLTPDALDAAFARHGLEPAEPTEAVRVPTERGHRTTVNALYRKPG
jgi:SAM-dependent methyltransferase